MKRSKKCFKAKRDKENEKNNHTGVVFLLVRPKSVRLHVNPFKKVWEFPKVLATWSVGWAQTCAVGQLQDLARRVSHLAAAYQSLPRVTSREKTCWSSKFLNCPNLPVLGTESKNQNGNLRWHLPWGGEGGLECHIPILKNDFFKNHLESFPDCENVFCT